MTSIRCGVVVPLLILLVAMLVAAANGESWTDERLAGRFHVHADFPLDDYEPLVRELESLHGELSRLLGVAAADRPIHLFFFRSRRSYEGYLKQYFPGAPYRRALFIQGRGPGMVFAQLGRHFEVDVRHEVTHALLHSALPIVPLWLDEGLAEYFEVPAEQREHGNPHRSAAWWAALFHRTRPLEELEQLQDVSQMGPGEYRAAWAWVHFLLHGPPPARQQLVALLRDIQADRVPPQMSARLRQLYSDPESQLRAHLRRSN